ncbi:DUF2934 domain-containing protein [Devosia geojensis]|uniref:DUF2934 domain-containing protein n=1 Tax=Devosia geojensis TaxID=443610 RepID=UPI000A04D757|nr:DUF2934 domain-containing protein [Devosia geojensis]
MQTPATDEQIRLRAYQIWETEGRPEGRAEEHWQQASDEVTLSRGDARADAADRDLDSNPGIGQSPGLDRDANPMAGENTVEGDVMNDTTRAGGIDPNQRGRTNK